jgi:FkbH-like protein
MTLQEALVIGNRPAVGAEYSLHFCCGFQPLHLATFLKAHLRTRLAGPGQGTYPAVSIKTGHFGDLAGNIDKALSSDAAQPLAVVMEWADLDPRLGFREGYRPQPDDEMAIPGEVAGRLGRIEKQLTGVVGLRRIVLGLPVAPLATWEAGLSGQASPFTLELRALLAAFAARCARAGIRVAELAVVPLGSSSAYDFRGHLQTGFPYSTPYADALAVNLASLLVPLPPKKGLVTDLDNTVWAGIVGDDGAANVHWSLEQHARAYGLYQQCLASLGAQGVLLAAASKNDHAPVSEALARPDLLFSPALLFPVEANWGPKSESLRRIAKAWKIGLDALVFVDDNELELAEVRQSLPEVECHLFPPAFQPAAILELVQTLRRRFAREQVTEEDRLRAASLRSSAEYAQAEAADPEALLSGLKASLTCSFARGPFDPRALELLNKTNQFNLNGERWEESNFRTFVQQPNTVLCVASYEDRFGSLGKIAVAVGIVENGAVRLRSWVISCRAFSRRVEFSTIQALLDYTNVSTLRLDWQSTPRNGPTREMLGALFNGGLPEAGMLEITREDFEKRHPPLYAATHCMP